MLHPRSFQNTADPGAFGSQQGSRPERAASTGTAGSDGVGPDSISAEAHSAPRQARALGTLTGSDCSPLTIWALCCRCRTGLILFFGDRPVALPHEHGAPGGCSTSSSVRFPYRVHRPPCGRAYGSTQRLRRARPTPCARSTTNRRTGLSVAASCFSRHAAALRLRPEGAFSRLY